MLDTSGEKPSAGKQRGEVALRDPRGGGDPVEDVRQSSDTSPNTTRLGRSEVCGWEGRSFPGRGAVFAKGPREERVFSIGGIEKGPQGLCVSSSGKEGTGSPPTGSGHPSESECAVGRQ